MERVEFDAFRRANGRTRAITWSFVVFASVAVGYGVALAWSYLGGGAVGIALFLAGLELHLALDRARWLRRFPELRNPREPHSPQG